MMTSTEPFDIAEIRADLEYASSGIDGADLPYHPHALHAMRAAEKLLAEVERLNDVVQSSEPIGPLTAAEWCEFRMRDDDLLQCCGVTSEMRDVIFYLLRMGGNTDGGERLVFEPAWRDMIDHGLPDGRGGELLERLRAFYLPETAAESPEESR